MVSFDSFLYLLMMASLLFVSLLNAISPLGERQLSIDKLNINIDKIPTITISSSRSLSFFRFEINHCKF
jgi:hypothetical protein